MSTNEEILSDAIQKWPGRDDDQLAKLTGISPRQQVNQIANSLESKGKVRRVIGSAGKLVNYWVEGAVPSTIREGN